jgi:hypothetical protein
MMTQSALETKVKEMEAPAGKVHEALDILLWFGFFGIENAEGEEKHAHMYQYGVKRMSREVGELTPFVILPAFRAVLICR